MPYACVEDPTSPTTSSITALFNMPQSDPDILGYIGEIRESDNRIPTFLDSLKSVPK